MKSLRYFTMLFFALALAACSGDSQVDTAAAEDAATVAKMDSLSQVLETTTNALHEDKENLENALDELDDLFPEEQ